MMGAKRKVVEVVEGAVHRGRIRCVLECGHVVTRPRKSRRVTVKTEVTGLGRVERQVSEPDPPPSWCYCPECGKES